MAIYNVGCVGAKLSLDTDNDLITIKRNSQMGLSLPETTEIKASEVTNIENQYQTYGIKWKGTGMLKFVYPGCPPGGDMVLLGATTNENIVQYKASHLDEMDSFLKTLNPIIDANKARNS